MSLLGDLRGLAELAESVLAGEPWLSVNECLPAGYEWELAAFISACPPERVRALVDAATATQALVEALLRGSPGWLDTPAGVLTLEALARLENAEPAPTTDDSPQAVVSDWHELDR